MRAPANAQQSALPVRAFAIRLAALGGIFAVAVLSEIRGGGSYSERELVALYALVLTGFLLSLAYGALRAWGNSERVNYFELTGDLILLTGLVYCSGGSRSLFGPLYIIWIVHVALAAGSRATILAWAGATICYGLVGLAPALGAFPAFEPGSQLGVHEALSSAGAHALAFLGVAILSRNLADQIQAGRVELRELGEIHQRIVDNVASGLLTVDRAARISSFNSEAERITGYGSAEVMGWPLAKLFPNLDPGETGDSAPADLPGTATQERGRMELVFESRNAQELHLGMSISILRDAGGHEDGAIVIFQDLTKVVQMEEQLRRSERLGAVGQLAAGLAHEIRNPLASLSGAIELLEGDLPSGDASSLRLARIVQRETARLNRLVSDFLTYARPGPGHFLAVPLQELMAEIAELDEYSEGRGCELELDIENGLSARGNPDQLRQVIWNLVINAAQSEPRDHKVRIEARGRVDESGAPRVHIDVIDCGCGIPPELVERIFEPFFTTKPKGTGLGLATVHRVIEAHGGQMGVRTEQGQGTVVSVDLPAA
ncbi:MAG: PAS domain S-box protein [bacterium]|nr:PAS domain S-box protein [bacterium]